MGLFIALPDSIAYSKTALFPAYVPVDLLLKRVMACRISSDYQGQYKACELRYPSKYRAILVPPIVITRISQNHMGRDPLSNRFAQTSLVNKDPVIRLGTSDQPGNFPKALNTEVSIPVDVIKTRRLSSGLHKNQNREFFYWTIQEFLQLDYRAF